MKKHFLHLFVLLLISLPTVLRAQTYVIDNFDSSAKDSLYQISVEGGISKIVLTDDATDKKEGSGSLKVNATIDALHQWGSFAQLIRTAPKDTYWDWSSSDSLSIWIKVTKAPTHPEWMVFRIHIGDQPTPQDPKEEYVFEHATILDTLTGWVNFKVPLTERVQTGTDIPNDQGFILAPTSWGGFQYNNRKLDRDKIVSYNIGIITSGWDAAANLPADSLEVSFDNFTRFGTRKVPFVVFNGKAVNSEMSMGAWGNSTSVAVVKGAGSVAGKNALKWTLDPQSWDGGKTGWCGIYFDFPAKNMGGNWKAVDTMKLRAKIPAEYNDDLRIQFGDGTGNIKYVFKKADYNWDGTWKTLKMPLQGGAHDGSATTFDSTKVNKFEIIDEIGTAKPCTIYLEDVWMGSPEFDVIAPVPPAGLQATASSDFTNLIAWTDDEGESGATYDVYSSKSPITDVNASGVDQVAFKIPQGTGTATHVLRTPKADGTVSYYYAVTCTDAAGNTSDVSSTSVATSNTAKGVPTILLGTPANFKADGNLSEFTSLYSSKDYKPISIKKSEGTGFAVANMPITDDNDCSALLYLAVDNQNLYVAFDVTDDYVDGTTAANTYERDCPDLYIGLYNFHGLYHSAYGRGATPDYHIRFNQNKAFFDGQALDSLIGPSESSYYWGEKTSNGYIVEAKIPLADMATKRNKGYNGDLDSVFVPVEGMRIPIDVSLNDADATGIREGILTYSPKNEDKSYQDVTRWTYTWIGDKDEVSGVEENNNVNVKTYSLSQNYPNPFNPSTAIRYSIPKAGMVTLKVFNILGKEVATLVHGEKAQGSYEVRFDASQLASGIYFYQLESGSFRQVNKMLLLK
ncbi:MAG TPA: sugar-binding protein [Ignavibacteriales bacterium]|nr:sugar-binding protein [Ignavibacteriales bacterium]